MLRVAELLAQLARPGIGVPGFRRRPALHGHQHHTQGDLQVEL
jgi:hypothetical protein